MSFLITSPMINEIAILVLASVLGIKITVIYVITGISVGVIGGFLMEKLGFEKYLQDYLKKLGANTGCCSCSCSGAKEVLTIKSKIKDAFIYTKDLMKI